MNDLVIEYLERKRLADMGFTQDLGDVTAEQAHAMLIIDIKRDEILNPAKPKGA